MVDMRNGACAVCGGGEIYTASTRMETPTALFGMLHTEKVDLYACVSCGFLQTFLDRTDDQVRWMRNSWKRV
ncbi:hypothetical protein ACFY19_05820 [Streptosporangium saharense]